MKTTFVETQINMSHSSVWAWTVMSHSCSLCVFVHIRFYTRTCAHVRIHNSLWLRVQSACVCACTYGCVSVQPRHKPQIEVWASALAKHLLYKSTRGAMRYTFNFSLICTYIIWWPNWYNAQLRQCTAGNSWSGIDDLHNGLLHGHSGVVTV